MVFISSRNCLRSTLIWHLTVECELTSLQKWVCAFSIAFSVPLPLPHPSLIPCSLPTCSSYFVLELLHNSICTHRYSVLRLLKLSTSMVIQELQRHKGLSKCLINFLTVSMCVVLMNTRDGVSLIWSPILVHRMNAFMYVIEFKFVLFYHVCVPCVNAVA